MTGTLILRLAAPLQSWGIDSKYDVRRTGREPSKSGVIGMIAAALGRGRDESVEDLNRLRFGVRVEQEGVLLTDYHMVHKASLKGNWQALMADYDSDKMADKEDSWQTRRDYLSDAVFLVGLEGDTELLQTISDAVNAPVYPLFLGRRSCPPTLPINLGIRDAALLDALRFEPWRAGDEYLRKYAQETVALRLIADAQSGESGGGMRKDVPASFASSWRRYGYRSAKDYGFVTLTVNRSDETRHDVMAELR